MKEIKVYLCAQILMVQYMGPREFYIDFNAT